MGRRRLLKGQLVLGQGGCAPLLTLREPVSFWGGVDPVHGDIIDRHHPQFGVRLAGTALLMGATRGSSSSSSTLLECIRRQTAPAMLLLTVRDALLVVGAAAAWEIYGSGPAVVMLPGMLAEPDGTIVHVDPDGEVYGPPSLPARGGRP